MKTRAWAWLAAAGFAALPSTAVGSVTFRFAFDQAEYTVIRGDTVAVPVYLEEVVTGGDPSLLLAEDGLFSAGVRFLRTSSTGNAPSSINGTAAVQPNTTAFFDASDEVFGPEVTVTGGSEAKLLEFARAAGVTGGPAGAGTRRLLLGTFIITGGARANQSTTFRAEDYNAASSDSVTWTNSLVIDVTPGIAPASVVITSIRGPCGIADFNNDGDVGTDEDIEAFFACLAGTCCTECESADFNGDGDTGTDQDIEAFFRVLAGGTC